MRPHDAIRRAARRYGLREEEIWSRNNSKLASKARRHAMLTLYEDGRSYAEVARCLNRRDHTTAMSAIRKARAEGLTPLEAEPTKAEPTVTTIVRPVVVQRYPSGIH